RAGLTAIASASAARTETRVLTEIADITAKRAGVANISVKLTERELRANLISSGYKVVRQDISSNGPFTVLSNGTKTYTIYTATSGGPAVEVSVAGRTVSKLRLSGS